MTVTLAQRRLLEGLDPDGGIFDRYLRIVAKGEIVASQGSNAPLVLFRDGLIEVDNQRVILTEMGRSVVKNLDPPEQPPVYKNPVCRGAWALGTACGHCERCEQTKPIGEDGI